MPNYCPLCEKKGIRNKIKLFQINLDEIVLACETEECTWPFGYEDIKYFPRKVGEMWSYYWNNYDIQMENNFVPAPLELSLYSPPETPFIDTLRDLTDLLSPDSTISISTINSNICSINTSTPCVSDHNDYCLKYATSKNIDNKSENWNIHRQNPDIDETIHEDDQKQSCYKNTVDVINKEAKNSDIMNINFNSDVICEFDTEIIYDTDTVETNLSNYKNGENSLVKDIEEIYYNINNHINERERDQSQTNIESSNSVLDSKTQINTFTEKSTTPSKLQVTSVEVNGLPVTFSYQVPTLPFSSNTVLNTSANFITPQSNTTSQSIGISSPVTSIKTISKSLDKKKESILKSKRHTKFNFNILKKKPNNVNNVINAIKNIVNNKDIVADRIQKQNSPVKTFKSSVDIDNNMEAKLTQNNIDENVHENMETELAKNDDKNVNNFDMDADLNIDSILNEFLEGDNTTKVNENNKIHNYDEDWIQSLLN
ncbi:arrestin domain-containing protein F-like [Polistes fuscatus]|uniref:arrestin domain-containing protein F-like n=1 Tax=Polistes fuscatus TaxID=30207 RepID=UPI001CA922B7|nr:arrestin domain-containing protein F-like [Polistes fuscatus]